MRGDLLGVERQDFRDGDLSKVTLPGVGPEGAGEVVAQRFVSSRDIAWAASCADLLAADLLRDR